MEFTTAELDDFKKNWGQDQEEICNCLDYDIDDEGTDEMIMGDGYFWLDTNDQWYPKTSSMYEPREQLIADYIYDNR
jgi:hypothetical protein